MDKTKYILTEVSAERARQDAKWGEQNHPDGTGGPSSEEMVRLAKARCDQAARDGGLTYEMILTEEFYEALAEIDPEKLRTELIQVAAVAVAWIECIDRRVSHG